MKKDHESIQNTLREAKATKYPAGRLRQQNSKLNTAGYLAFSYRAKHLISQGSRIIAIDS
ncbi:hypothetical protein [Trichormus variabilis]|uniref:hypothetical protein n=1 Tax=Anabaena variabilis TaxID=264691 RepID=UPI00031C4A6E|nr:hypothetical protein [Trichormus variabilis]